MVVALLSLKLIEELSGSGDYVIQLTQGKLIWEIIQLGFLKSLEDGCPPVLLGKKGRPYMQCR
jgi:hypothetical protein